jgi:hypothetical protein
LELRVPLKVFGDNTSRQWFIIDKYNVDHAG